VGTRAGEEKFQRLSETAKKLQTKVQIDPQARDLVREKLATLVGGQSLLDYSNVFILPDTDDIDNYMQGVLDDVAKTEVPNPDDFNAKGSPQSLAAGQVFPAPNSIGSFLASVIDSALKLSKSGGGAKRGQILAKAREIEGIARRRPESRDLIASRLDKLGSTTTTTTTTTSLIDHRNVFITPDPDDLDNHLQGVLDDVAKIKVPDPDSIKAKSLPTVESLLPIDPIGEDVMDKYAYPRKGAYRDEMQWQQHPFDHTVEDGYEPHKLSGDRFARVDNKMVYGGASTVHGEVENPYGAQRFTERDHDDGESAEAEGQEEAQVKDWGRAAEYPISSADGPDVGASVGVETEESMNKGSKLCQLVNCDGGRSVNPFPQAKAFLTSLWWPQGAQQQARPELGDEIFSVPTSAGDDVIMSPSDPSISSATYMARAAPIGDLRRQQLSVVRYGR